MINKAFTILELLVVISVLVILIAIAIPRFKGMQDSARLAQAKKELQTLQAAVESYKTFTGNYPAYDSGGITTTLVGSFLSLTSPQIVATALYDPFYSGHEYYYKLDPGKKYYVIYSAGLSGSSTPLNVSHPDDGCVDDVTFCPELDSFIGVTNGRIEYGCYC